MMGGMLTWMFVLQAIAVGALFIGANYYLWQGMARMPGSERYHRYIKYILYGLVLSFLVWFTPHTLVLTSEEAKDIGGDRKSTRLNSSHVRISYAVFCLKKKNALGAWY